VEDAGRLLALGRVAEAVAAFDRILLIAPLETAAHFGRGLALKACGQSAAALDAFERAIAIDGHCVPAHVNCAALLLQLGRSREALASCERALALQPDFAPAHCNRGQALFDLGDPVAALASYDRALAIDPNFPAAHGNRAKALQTLDRPAEALAGYQRVTALVPDSPQAALNASHVQLLLGNYEAGWTLYEARKRVAAPLGNRMFSFPPWLGEGDLAGKRLLLHWEQGLGDTIQFCRYALLARARGARVTLLVQRSLRRLIETLDSSIAVVGDEPVSEGFDCHCPLLSLPYAFRTIRATVPAQVPYLCADPERVKLWHQRLGGAGFKVGISWQGNALSPADRGRSVPLALFQHLSEIPGVRLISLQKNAGSEQSRALPPAMRIECLGDDFDAGVDAFVDTAAVMECLDVVVTSDTAVAHLAGALGRPVWIALQQVPDWRWLREGTDSPWYPQARLFRQTQRGQWDPVFERIAEALRGLVTARAP
jgi:Flp pilus assembly protein TadD